MSTPAHMILVETRELTAFMDRPADRQDAFDHLMALLDRYRDSIPRQEVVKLETLIEQRTGCKR